MHEPVLAAVEGRESHGADKFPSLQFRRTHRADLGVAGYAFGLRLHASPPSGKAAQSRDAHAEKKGIPEPEKNDSYYCKNEYSQKLSHVSPLADPLK
jgi:hypothetical protein